jgi:3-deoxy-D-manno-octulosonic acid kinase
VQAAPTRSQRRSSLGALGFATFRAYGQTLYLRKDLLSEAGSLLTLIAESERAGDGAGNRGSGFRVELNRNTGLFVRRARRGGWIRPLNRDLYFGLRPRPLHELAIAAEAARRAIPIAEPIGALVEPLAPAIYRGAMITRALTGMTLWEFLQTDDDPRVRAHVLALARRAIETMHRGGLFHADLNLHNLFVTQSGESFVVVILDLDKAWLSSAALPVNGRRRNMRRLIRSAHKLDPAGRLLTPAALSILTGD